MSLTYQLQGLVESYFERNPHMSMNALALKSGVGATTLRRIRSNSIKGDPAPHTVLGLVSSITNEKRLSVLIKQFDGPIGDLLGSTFGPYVEEELQHEYAPDLNFFLKDSTRYFVYKLAANKSGVTEDEVALNYGQLGLKRLGELIENKLIEEKGEKFHAVKKNYSLDLQTVVQHLPELVSHYKPEAVSEGKNLFYTMSESLNEEGIQKIKSIQKDAIKKILTVMQSPYYEGEIPFFTVDMCDTLEMPNRNEVLQ